MKIPIVKLVVFYLLLNPNILAQPIVINELYNSGSSDEWIELLVVNDGLDIRNWSIRDFRSGGSAQTPLVFSNNMLWSNLKREQL